MLHSRLSVRECEEFFQIFEIGYCFQLWGYNILGEVTKVEIARNLCHTMCPILCCSLQTERTNEGTEVLVSFPRYLTQKRSRAEVLAACPESKAPECSTGVNSIDDTDSRPIHTERWRCHCALLAYCCQCCPWVKVMGLCTLSIAICCMTPKMLGNIAIS